MTTRSQDITATPACHHHHGHSIALSIQEYFHFKVLRSRNMKDFEPPSQICFILPLSIAVPGYKVTALLNTIIPPLYTSLHLAKQSYTRCPSVIPSRIAVTTTDGRMDCDDQWRHVRSAAPSFIPFRRKKEKKIFEGGS